MNLQMTNQGTYDFKMTSKEIQGYLFHENIPQRFSEHRNSAFFWYAMFGHCATYGLEQMKNPTPAEKQRELLKLAKLFLSRKVLVELFENKEIVHRIVMEYARESEFIYIGREQAREVWKPAILEHNAMIVKQGATIRKQSAALNRNRARIAFLEARLAESRTRN